MNEEANQKLLELAGFKFTPLRTGMVNGIKVKLWDAHWLAPDEKPYKDENMLNYHEPPNFFHPIYGLGWLFKYVVPKMLGTIDVRPHRNTKAQRQLAVSQFLKRWVEDTILHEVEPQAALANAILKWLESEKK